MPIYEYHCRPCGRRFELLTTISRADQAVCPKCGSGDVRRLVSTFAARTSGGEGSSGSSSCAGCSAASCRSCGSR